MFVYQCLPVVVIGGVSDLAEGTIGLEQRVFSLHDITIADFVLGLVVTSVGVRDWVGVVVFRVGLERREILFDIEMVCDLLVIVFPTRIGRKNQTQNNF